MYNQGDVLENEDGKRKILRVCGEVYFLSKYDDLNSYGGGYTVEDLERFGYYLEGKETIEIQGKKYLLKDVEKRVKKLKEVE